MEQVGRLERLRRWVLTYALACHRLHMLGERAWPWNVRLVWDDTRLVVVEYFAREE